MPTRPFRFQADASDGSFRSGQFFDEVTAQHPVTDEIEGTGTLLPPVVLTPEDHPELFAALDAIAGKTGERVSAARAKLVAAKAEAAAEIGITPATPKE